MLYPDRRRFRDAVLWRLLTLLFIPIITSNQDTSEQHGLAREIPPQGGPVRGFVAVWYDLQYLFQWSVHCVTRLACSWLLTLALLLGYDAGIMTVILADEQFTNYYSITPDRQGVVATIPWATTGLAQLFIGGTLASWLGRIWALRISIVFMCLGV